MLWEAQRTEDLGFETHVGRFTAGGRGIDERPGRTRGAPWLQGQPDDVSLPRDEW
jgi:hypothetical protein